MSADPIPVYGVVRDGVIVPESPGALAEGIWVVITPMSFEFTPAERAEFEMWEQLGDEAWRMIDEWEKNGFPDLEPPAEEARG